MFKQSIKLKKTGEIQKKNQTKNVECSFMPKNGMCTGKNEKQKVKIHRKQTKLHYLNY